MNKARRSKITENLCYGNLRYVIRGFKKPMYKVEDLYIGHERKPTWG